MKMFNYFQISLNIQNICYLFTGSNVIYSWNGFDFVSMLSKCYEFRRPNKVSRVAKLDQFKITENKVHIHWTHRTRKMKHETWNKKLLMNQNWSWLSNQMKQFKKKFRFCKIKMNPTSSHLIDVILHCICMQMYLKFTVRSWTCCNLIKFCMAHVVHVFHILNLVHWNCICVHNI